VQISLLEAAHYESLVDLLREVHGYYNPGSSVSRELVRSHLVDRLLSDGSPLHLVVATREPDLVVGFAAITLTYSLVDPTPDAGRQCWLKELYVRASERSQGAGGALMSWVARYAVENGCARIDWPVRANNDRGIAFYERLGATRVEDRLSYRLTGSELHALANRSGSMQEV